MPTAPRRFRVPSFAVFRAASWSALLDEFPKLEKRLLNEASNELIAAQDQMLLLGRKTAAERLATFLDAALAQRRQGSPGSRRRGRICR